jgi:hypothetical protein
LGFEASKQYKGYWKEEKDPDNAAKNKNNFYLNEDEKPRFIENSVRVNMIQFRKNKLQRAETGAMLRVIRTALGMRGQYTMLELQKPFLVPRIDFAPDLSDPHVRDIMISQGAQSLSSLFGGPAMLTEQIMMRPAITAINDDESTITIDAELQTKEAVATVEPEPVKAEPVKPKIEEPKPVAEPPKSEFTCSLCNAKITEKVANFSRDKLGAVLCMPCQKKGAGS